LANSQAKLTLRYKSTPNPLSHTRFFTNNIITILIPKTYSNNNLYITYIATVTGGLIPPNHGTNRKHLQKDIVENINPAMPQILILLLIDSLAGTWIISGVVPEIIYFELKTI